MLPKRYIFKVNFNVINVKYRQIEWALGLDECDEDINGCVKAYHPQH